MAAGTERNNYANYLQLEKLLSAQVTRTGSDDELLFIIMHQSHELWFKLAIHELACATRALIEGSSGKDCLMAFKRLSRVSEIQRLLIRSWDVLTTLTPDEFFLFARRGARTARRASSRCSIASSNSALASNTRRSRCRRRKASAACRCWTPPRRRTT